jgi:mRNA deadenylase 3'-5' endonuclease subunit Ccr4
MASAAPSPSYKVLTYNTLIAFSHEGQNWCEKNLPALKTLSWNERRSRLVAKMVETDPDVITLQEVVDREGQATFKQFQDSLREKGYTGQFGRRPDGEHSLHH